MKRLAIVTTHPIQYNAPLFKLLTERRKIEIKVFYTWSQTALGKKFDPGFGKNIEWDIPLLEGYEYSFVENIATHPGSHHYKGINNPTLTKEIQVWGANAIMVYGWNFKSHLGAIRFFSKKIPVFFRGDSILMNEQNSVKRLMRRIFLRIIYSYIDIAFYVGSANKAYFKAMGLDEKQLVFVPHAVDNNRFAPKERYVKNAAILKTELGVGANSLLFLYAGKLDANKNVAVLINAFIALNTNKHFLLIVGNGEEEAELKKSSQGHSNIKFLDFQNQLQMPILYAAADVFILPSKTETWGLAINEAMIAGKAIIASSTCGAALDLVKLNKNGFVFNSHDIFALTKALEHFIKDKNASKLMGMESLKIIKHYNYEEDCIAIENTTNKRALLAN